MSFEDDIKKLREMLQSACLVEFSTIPAYLTGWWSIKDRRSTAAKLIRELVTVEMRHLSIAANVLIATGADPDIKAVASLPYPRFFSAPGPMEIQLQPFGDSFLAMGMCIESPGPVDEGTLPEGLRAALPVTAEFDPRLHTPILPDPGETIGQFYRDLMQHLKDCVHLYGEKAVFPAGRLDRQYAYFGQDCITVEGLDDALTLMQDIIWEGEGDGGGILDSNRDLSHYFTFHELSVGRFYRQDDKPLDPTGDGFHVPKGDEVVNTLVNPKLANYEENPDALKAALGFTELYQKMITDLDAGFRGRPALIDVAIGRMRQLLARADEVLVCKLKGMDYYAAPTFELPDQ
ncbi:ferritin-like domain-containing protein [Kitasatospora sp. MY 5-36]|uniref:ferritin-like domain-containing protein n=1 Tax=Kitasatospora sp. MY 5-36 TaxID=1678027 RepID=UPI0006708320|nr:ferritin-like domain-containing protein [Kitasatospora sp. MY 5-36]